MYNLDVFTKKVISNAHTIRTMPFLYIFNFIISFWTDLLISKEYNLQIGT